MLVERARNLRDCRDRGGDLGIQSGCEGRVFFSHQIQDAGACYAAGIVGGEHHLDASGVAHDVTSGVVGEAGVLVFLRTLGIRHIHALARKLATRKLADAGDDVVESLAVAALEEACSIVAGVGRPLVADLLQVGDEQVGCHSQILGAAVSVGAAGVVGHGAVAGAGCAEVLPPEEEFYGVPACGDIFFAAFFVEGCEQFGVDRGICAGIVDDACVGCAFHIIYVCLVQRPSVD